MILQVPAATPVTTPVEETVAMAGLALLHIPPGVAQLSAEVPPTMVVVVPVMGDIDKPTVMAWKV